VTGTGQRHARQRPLRIKQRTAPGNRRVDEADYLKEEFRRGVAGIPHETAGGQVAAQAGPPQGSSCRQGAELKGLRNRKRPNRIAAAQKAVADITKQIEQSAKAQRGGPTSSSSGQRTWDRQEGRIHEGRDGTQCREASSRLRRRSPSRAAADSKAAACRACDRDQGLRRPADVRDGIDRNSSSCG